MLTEKGKTMREKLIELICSTEYGNGSLVGKNFQKGFIEKIADQLIANGVTVGKSLTEYLHPVDNYVGLKGKYLVFKADTGERVVNCFVLCPDKDTAAVEALRAYARSTDNKTLSNDIYNWVGKGVTVQEWISVKDRLPKEMEPVLAFAECGHIQETGRWTGHKWEATWDFEELLQVTHWMPLPAPPKEE